MHAIYNLLTGVLIWVSVAVFLFGCIYTLVSRALMAKKKDGIVYSYFNFYYAVRSILHWVVPYAARNWRNHPFFTVVTFLFHICLLAMPLLLFAHIALFNEAWDVSWWFLPETVADVATVIVILSCLFFLGRRLFLKDVRFLSSASDYALLALVAAPYVTGLWAGQQWAGHDYVLLLHIFTGELLLALIPFTKLGHMIFFLFTRGYIGSEFGAVRHAKDW
ncbi:MAG: TmcC family electron transfer complex membrane anchor subunit [Desulfatibacillaceae bacterium]